jgi:Zn-dependent protease with chaperone function
VYLSPGSEIGVHQTGRGPFGLFGVKSRVLTLGLSTMRFLTVSELEAILAHEYAHFSHRDTFYSRFIYQVHLSIGQALWGKNQYGGYLNNVNPFYWFLFLYYKSYSLLSAGFFRSREFLADRMAASLYGSDVFISALTKASTDGLVFEKAIFSHLNNFSETQTEDTNIYDVFRNFRAKGLSQEEREQEQDEMLAEKASLFAQYPTVAERLAAIGDMPHGVKTNAAPALSLFEYPAEIELELSQFLTSYFFAIRQLQMQAAQNAG